MLPTFKVPDSHTPDSFLAELAFEGLHERFKELHDARSPTRSIRTSTARA